MTAALLIVCAYLLGAVPFGLLIGRARGVDIRQHGSRNIGATNAGRVLGKKWGYLCLVLDILKGFVPALVAYHLLVSHPIDPPMLLRWILVGLAAVLGHVFPIYLLFRGGKGVATTIGVALGIFPYYTVAISIALVGYAIGRFGSGMVAVGSLILAVVFPAAVFAYIGVDSQLSFQQGWPLWAAASVLGAVIIVRHTGNISRMLKGAEPTMKQVAEEAVDAADDA